MMFQFSTLSYYSAFPFSDFKKEYHLKNRGWEKKMGERCGKGGEKVGKRWEKDGKKEGMPADPPLIDGVQEAPLKSKPASKSE